MTENPTDVDNQSNRFSLLDKRWFTTVLLTVLFLLVGAAWWWIPKWLGCYHGTNSLAESGQLGDSYGSVNSLFTGLALSALILTVLLQQRELSLQREELKAQLKEMSLSRIEIERQTAVREAQVRLLKADLLMKPLEARIERAKLAQSDVDSRQGRGFTSRTALDIIKEMFDVLESADIKVERPEGFEKEL